MLPRLLFLLAAVSLLHLIPSFLHVYRSLYMQIRELWTILFTALRHTHKSTYAAKEKPTVSFIYLEKNLWYISDEIPKHIAMSSGEEEAAVAAEAVRKELLNRR